MPELWFFLGLTIGIALMGFVTIGSCDRGVESARLRPWKLELVARKHASIAARARHPMIAAFVPDLASVPLPASVVTPERTRPVPAAERRTRIRRDPHEILTHISL